jgi:hypothetical protein
MKIREGFVSNSSSSSFIFSRKPGTPATLTVEINLAEYAKIYRTWEEVKKFYAERYEEGWEEDHAREIAKIKAALDRGEEVLIGKVYSDGGGAEVMILTEGLEGASPNVNLIRDTNY